MSTSTRRERERQQRRDAIIEAAEGLFSEKGFEGTTMQEISDRVELSKGTIYLYFKSKEELYLSVCINSVAGFGESLEAAVMGVRDLESRIKAVYLAYIRHSLEQPAVFRVLRDTFLERVRLNLSKSAIDEISAFIKGWLENESRLIQEGIDSGVFDGNLDPYAFSLSAWRMSTGLIELALLEDPGVVDPEHLEAVFESSIGLLVKGARSG